MLEKRRKQSDTEAKTWLLERMFSLITGCSQSITAIWANQVVPATQTKQYGNHSQLVNIFRVRNLKDPYLFDFFDMIDLKMRTNWVFIKDAIREIRDSNVFMDQSHDNYSVNNPYNHFLHAVRKVESYSRRYYSFEQNMQLYEYLHFIRILLFNEPLNNENRINFKFCYCYICRYTSLLVDSDDESYEYPFCTNEKIIHWVDEDGLPLVRQPVYGTNYQVLLYMGEMKSLDVKDYDKKEYKPMKTHYIVNGERIPMINDQSDSIKRAVAKLQFKIDLMRLEIFTGIMLSRVIVAGYPKFDFSTNTLKSLDELVKKFEMYVISTQNKMHQMYIPKRFIK